MAETNGLVSAFFYGTLMHPAVIKRVIGNNASHLQAAPAVLTSFTRHHVRGCDYPAIVPYNVGSTLLKRELEREDRCVRGVIISGLTPQDVAHLDVFEGDEYNRVAIEAHPIVPLAPISSNLTQTLLSASSELPAELPPALQVQTYVWAAGTSRLEPVIWQYDTFVKEKLWKWAGSGASQNEDYQEVDRRRDMGGVIVVPTGGEGELKPDYTFGHPMLQYFMFDKGYINLNHGSYGSVPRQVFDKCIEINKRSEGRPDSFHRREYQDELLDCRTKVAKLMNCDTEECAITNNTTHGVHTILNNFHWKKNDIVVGFSTTYGAVFNILEYIADTPPHPTHVNIPLEFPLSHAEVVIKLREQLKSLPRHEGQTVVVVIDALVSNPGVLLPWEEMTKVCKEEGAYSLIDAAHAIGQVDIDLAASQPDFFVSNCHKWLYAKRAAAVIYIPQRNQHLVHSSFPTSHDYISVKSGLKPDIVHQFDWTGTIDLAPFLSISHAIKFREDIGGEKKINDYCHSLAVKGGKILAEVLKTRVMESEKSELTANMVNVQLPLTTPAGVSPRALKPIFKLIIDKLIDEHNAFAAIYVHGGHWWTRCSAQIWNEEYDFEYIGKAFLKICTEVQERLNELNTSHGPNEVPKETAEGTDP
ncbi:PLP-dependent transferase [Ceratobasidium sp. AG-I]|nr:PLP-dependent transferase [Ceratobasidium sp. AG-I]